MTRFQYYQDNIKPFILNKNGHINSHVITEKYLRKHNPELLEWFLSIYEEIESISEKICLLEHQLESAPVCPICRKKLKFRSIEKGFGKFCSRQCRFSEEGIRIATEIQKETNLRKYGVEHSFQSENNKRKTKETNLRKYGVENPNQRPEVREKIKKTVKERYGTDVYWQSDNFHEKSKRTRDEKKEAEWKEKYRLDISHADDGDLIIKNACEKHGDIKINIHIFHNRLKQNQNLCPICNSIHKEGTSYMEIQIKEWLEGHNIEYIMHSREIIPPYELDFYITKKGIAIECNGVYWHSELVLNDRYYHRKKYLKCGEQDIQLIQIWEDDFRNKPEIIYDTLESKLRLTKNKIYARECVCKEVLSDECTEFLDKNHLQGSVRASVRYGLYYADDLVAVMTFGPLRKNLGQSHKEGSWELYRYAVKSGCSVVGGASKLLNHFKKNNEWTEIISYAKCDISNGNLYKKLGFKFDEMTKPGYYWVHKSGIDRENRFKYRKSEISDENNVHLSEAEIMHEKGYYRVYDSGNLKFKLLNDAK